MRLKVKPYTSEQAKALLGRYSPTFVVVHADDDSPCLVQTDSGACTIRFASTPEKAEKIKSKLERTYGTKWTAGTSLKQPQRARPQNETRRQRRERLGRKTLDRSKKKTERREESALFPDILELRRDLSRQLAMMKRSSLSFRESVPDRIFRSPTKFAGFRPAAQNDTPKDHRFKPQGLWYACGDAWDAFLVREDWFDRMRHPYVYEIEVDLSSMVVIRDQSDFDAFNTEYGKVSRLEGESEQYIQGVDKWGGYYIDQWGGIDWPAVAKTYAGIEICPMVYPRPVPKWFEHWDVASGCIWGKRAFKSVRLIEHQDWAELP